MVTNLLQVLVFIVVIKTILKLKMKTNWEKSSSISIRFNNLRISIYLWNLLVLRGDIGWIY